ncbi:MAG: hypothetical protein PVI83_01855 [Lysobacterales bacterium]|jgi:hypothetical protein
MSVSRLQLELLRQAFARGSEKLKSALQMIAGIAPEDVNVKVIACRPGEFHDRTRIGSEPLVLVESNVHGDVEGDILLVQRHADFQVFGRVIENAMLGISSPGSEDGFVPDWLAGNDHATPDEETTCLHCEDAFTEMGNVLFSGLLVSLYDNFQLATFQDLPRLTSLDRQQVTLRKNLSRATREGDVALSVEIECFPGGNDFKSWLVFLPLSSGVRTFLEHQTARGVPRPAKKPGMPSN